LYNRGYLVTGFDVNKNEIEYAKKQVKDKSIKTSNLRFHIARATNLPYKNNYFDVIVMNDFLEHVQNPSLALKIAREMLKKDGLIFIATPKADSLIAKLSGKKWLHMKPDEHIYYFSYKTIRELLEKAGFKVIKQRSLGRVRNLEIIFLKIGTYTDIFYKSISFFKLNKILRNMSFNLDPGDEMGVFALKK
jgi:2-polyprenyl-3-methyl-5-hydroxy-6-metoxy-1,4-benzoquinol methylase